VKNAKETIADLSGGQERITAMEEELKVLKKNLLSAAKALNSERVQAAEKLGTLVTHEISALSMPHTIFHVDVLSVDFGGPLKESDFTPTGCDEISMSIQGHRDAPKVALGKGASGGEMSRIMLAIELVFSQSVAAKTMIFDEVDAGIGGAAAIEVGKRLQALAKHHQIVVVTHLPQVAAFADKHLKVEKSASGNVTTSSVTELDQKARVTEIARMMAGIEDSTSALEHARELLEMSNSKSL